MAGDPMDYHVTLVGGRTDGCPDVVIPAGDHVVACSEPTETLRDHGVADIGGGPRGALQEAQEGLEFSARDCLAAVEASVAREFLSQAAPQVDDDEPVAATAVARVTRLLAS